MEKREKGEVASLLRQNGRLEQVAEGNSQVVETSREAYRTKFANMVWVGGSVVAVMGVPMSLMRAHSIGLQPAHYVHIAVLLFVVTGWLFWWRRSTTVVKCLALVAMSLAIGVAGILNFGLMANGILYLTYSAFVCSVLFSWRVSVLYSTLIFIFIVLVGYLFVSGSLDMGFDANAYAVLPSAWATTTLGSSSLFLFSFIAVAVLQKQNKELLEMLRVQIQQIALLADHDTLTGLPVSRVARDRAEMAINHARRRNENVAVLFIDLDGFKSINDTLGHEVGDEVLKRVAAALSAEVRDEDTVGRIGGDEFIIILPSTDADAARAVAERIIASLSAMFSSGYADIRAGASIGIALFPDHGGDFDELRRQADQAMYTVKKTGKNGFALGSPGRAADALSP